MIGESLNRPPTRSQVAAIFRDKLNLEVPSVEEDLFETGALDSLAFVSLLVHLEQAFEVKVSLDDLELDDFRSIARIAELIDARLAVPRAAPAGADVAGLSAAGRGAV
jgi:acyl carrier protein